MLKITEYYADFMALYDILPLMSKDTRNQRLTPSVVTAVDQCYFTILKDRDEIQIRINELEESLRAQPDSKSLEAEKNVFHALFNIAAEMINSLTIIREDGYTASPKG